MTYPFLYVSSFTSPLTNYIPEVECIIAILNIEFIIEVHDHESDVFSYSQWNNLQIAIYLIIICQFEGEIY